MTRQFKGGDVCVTRGGQKAKVIEDDGSSIPLLVKHGAGRYRWHKRDGRRAYGNWSKHRADLVGLWNENKEDTAVTYDIKAMGVERYSLLRAIDGDRAALLEAFTWLRAPQGYEYWESQHCGKTPLDTDALKEIYRQAFGGEPEHQRSEDRRLAAERVARGLREALEKSEAELKRANDRRAAVEHREADLRAELRRLGEKR